MKPESDLPDNAVQPSDSISPPVLGKKQIVRQFRHPIGLKWLRNFKLPLISGAVILAGIATWNDFVAFFKDTLGALVGSSAFQLWIHQNALPILAVTVAFSLLLLIISEIERRLAIAELHRYRINESRRKIVLFLNPSPDGAFYEAHLSALLRHASKASDGDLSIFVSVVCPPNAFARHFAPELAFDHVEEYPAKVSGVFMIPSDPDNEKNLAGIKRFMRDNEQLTTVLLDVYPGTAGQLGEWPFVGGDERSGGELAARLGVRFLNEKYRKRDPGCMTHRILVLKGRCTAWENQRVEAFKSWMRQAFSNAEIFESHYLHYAAGAAHRVVTNLGRVELLQLEDNCYIDLKLTSIDLIFACNDDMATGAVEALEQFCTEGAFAHDDLPKVIGYDGTKDMLRSIDEGKSFILGTVQVDIDLQAEFAVSMMTKLLKGAGQDPDSGQPYDLVCPSLKVNDRYFDRSPR